MKWAHADFLLIRTIQEQFDETLIARLEELHITTLEDLIVLWDIEGLKNVLAQHLQRDVEKMEEIIAQSRRKISLQHIHDLLKPVPPEQLALCCFGLCKPPDRATPIQNDLPRNDSGSDSEKRFRIPLKATSVNHIPQLKPIQNQGKRGTCVAFGTAAVREFLLGDGAPKLSEQFLYYGAKMRDGLEDQPGTYIRCALECLEQDGICTEATWPYNPEPTDTEHQGPPPDEAAAEAEGYTITERVLVPERSVDAMRAVLAGTDELSARIISIGVPVFNSWFRNPITFRTGRIPMPLPDEEVIGGHCMAVVGYEDDETWPGGGYFIVRNSWGTVWAAESPYGAGYGLIPYAYIEQYSWEAYTMKTEEDGNRSSGLPARAFGMKAVAFGSAALCIAVCGLATLFFFDTLRSFWIPSRSTPQVEIDTSHSAPPREPQPTSSLPATGASDIIDASSDEQALAALCVRTMPEAYIKTYPFYECFQRAATAHGVPVQVALALAKTLSHFEPRYSIDDRYGIMRLGWPQPAKQYGVAVLSDLRDACTNITAACEFLGALFQRHRGIVPALLAYRHQDAGYTTAQPDAADTAFIRTMIRALADVLSMPYQHIELLPCWAYDKRQHAENFIYHLQPKLGVSLVLEKRGTQYVVLAPIRDEHEKRSVLQALTSSAGRIYEE